MERGKRGSGKPVSGRRKPGNDTKRPYSIKKEGDYKSKDRAEKPTRPYGRGGDEKSDRPYTRKEGEHTERKRFEKPEKTYGRSNDESRERPHRERSDKPEFNKDKPAREVRRKRINRDGTPARDDHRKKRYDEPRPRRDVDSPSRDKRTDDRPERKSYDKPDKPFTRRDDEKSDRPYTRKREEDRTERKSYDKPDKPFTRRDDDKTDRPFTRKSDEERPEHKSYDSADKPFSRKSDEVRPERKPYGKPEKSFTRRDDERSFGHKKEGDKKNFSKSRRPEKPRARGGESRERPYKESLEGVRLNKFIANAGICSRREADAMIESGVVSINDVVITQLGTRVQQGDVVKYGGQTLRGERLRYILLNKPKGYISTTDDPHSRDTVMLLVAEACKERIYPVGRLDRNTSGLLLFTNDGELAKKLTHPKHRVEKIYHVELDRGLTAADMKLIAEGIELDDGPVQVNDIAYTGEGGSKKKIGIVIHSGRNRIVRRIFEKLDYNVVKLDRTVFAGLNKKDLPRAAWRHLTEEEVNILRRIR
jgi:23S rRNA pseudouridine2605 synthase